MELEPVFEFTTKVEVYVPHWSTVEGNRHLGKMNKLNINLRDREFIIIIVEVMSDGNMRLKKSKINKENN